MPSSEDKMNSIRARPTPSTGNFESISDFVGNPTLSLILVVNSISSSNDTSSISNGTSPEYT